MLDLGEPFVSVRVVHGELLLAVFIKQVLALLASFHLIKHIGVDFALSVLLVGLHELVIFGDVFVFVNYNQALHLVVVLLRDYLEDR